MVEWAASSAAEALRCALNCGCAVVSERRVVASSVFLSHWWSDHQLLLVEVVDVWDGSVVHRLGRSCRWERGTSFDATAATQRVVHRHRRGRRRRATYTQWKRGDRGTQRREGLTVSDAWVRGEAEEGTADCSRTTLRAALLCSALLLTLCMRRQPTILLLLVFPCSRAEGEQEQAGGEAEAKAEGGRDERRWQRRQVRGGADAGGGPAPPSTNSLASALQPPSLDQQQRSSGSG